MAKVMNPVVQRAASVGNADGLQKNRLESMTLTQFIMDASKGDRQMALLMNTIQHACKVCANAIKKAGPCDLYGLAGQQNSTGDDVKKLDVISNVIWVDCLKGSGVCSLLVSEEEEEPIIIKGKTTGPFCVAFDPLDGSSNIDCNVSVGSIFSVYRRKSESGPATLEDILRPGNECVAAGYSMYGAATELVITLKSSPGVFRFALDTSIGEFLFVEQVKIPENGGKKIYSCNEGNSHSWDNPIRDIVKNFKTSGYTARYVGSMVSDVHRTLLYGGIFLYPADKKSKKGKLRVLYEGFPMAMITEAAGGKASTGMYMGKIGSILDVVPEHIHDKCPIIMGGERDVKQVLEAYEKEQK
eukprot:TRINITY_DN5440_c0_g1_i1.p1 TRINITY_DN5440_c0_g1~~TRINITY_DN5440_c0_g1_i1.p1  ORF type:complete len:356 (-),score=130.10 TRINITY_DN5440_c0_g1_i1:190-1257(-)